MQCEGKTNAGKKCGAPAIENTQFCNMHTPGRAAELGRRGGRRRTVYNSDDLQPFEPPQDSDDLCKLLGQSLIDVRNGTLDPKVANCMGFLGTAFLQAREAGNIESRLRSLEAKVQR